MPSIIGILAGVVGDGRANRKSGVSLLLHIDGLVQDCGISSVFGM